MRRPDDPTISTDAQSGEGFLGRWARRKRETLSEPSSEPLVEPRGRADEASGGEPARDAASALTADVCVIDDGSGTSVPGTAPEPGAAEQTQDVVLTDADMPPLSSLGDEDDYSGFMSPGVSEALRKKALRQLFMSAQFNVLDGLNDYDDDFTTFEALGDIVTSDMRHQIEMEAERAEREAQRLALDEVEQRQPMLDDAVPSQDAIGADAGTEAEADTGRDEVDASQGNPFEMDDPDRADPVIDVDERLVEGQLALATDTQQRQQQPQDWPGSTARSDESGNEDESRRPSGSTGSSRRNVDDV